VSDTIKAMIWMIGAITSFTAMAIAGREVSGPFDTFEIMFYRSCVGIMIVVGIGWMAGTLGQVRTQRPWLHARRNMTHFIGQNLWFFAIPLIPLAQLFALEFTTPIWVILLSPLFLSERITAIGLISAGIGFLGILLVANPAGASIGVGFFAAAGCAVFFALTAIFTRKLTQTESITCILFYITTMQAVFGLLTAGWDMQIRVPVGSEVLLLILIGCAGLMAHYCMTNALSLASASVVMPIDFARLPIIAVVGAVFYNELLSPLIFVGAALILGANYLNVTRGQGRQPIR